MQFYLTRFPTDTQLSLGDYVDEYQGSSVIRNSNGDTYIIYDYKYIKRVVNGSVVNTWTSDWSGGFGFLPVSMGVDRAHEYLYVLGYNNLNAAFSNCVIKKFSLTLTYISQFVISTFNSIYQTVASARDNVKMWIDGVNNLAWVVAPTNSSLSYNVAVWDLSLGLIYSTNTVTLSSTVRFCLTSLGYGVVWAKGASAVFFRTITLNPTTKALALNDTPQTSSNYYTVDMRTDMTGNLIVLAMNPTTGASTLRRLDGSPNYGILSTLVLPDWSGVFFLDTDGKIYVCEYGITSRNIYYTTVKEDGTFNSLTLYKAEVSATMGLSDPTGYWLTIYGHTGREL